MPLLRLTPASAPETLTLPLTPQVAARPLISCIMATRGDPFPARYAIQCYQQQNYANRELVIICADRDSGVKQLVTQARDPTIRMIEDPMARTVGSMRNAAIAAAAGDLVCTWDDDDLSHPQRLDWQWAALHQADAAASLLSQVMLWWPARRWLAISGERIWENSMLARKAELPPYPDMIRGSDSAMMIALRSTHPLVLIKQPTLYCYIAHDRNLWGADHFQTLFDASENVLDETAYQESLIRLSSRIPMQPYEAERGARP